MLSLGPGVRGPAASPGGPVRPGLGCSVPWGVFRERPPRGRALALLFQPFWRKFCRDTPHSVFWVFSSVQWGRVRLSVAPRMAARKASACRPTPFWRLQPPSSPLEVPGACFIRKCWLSHGIYWILSVPWNTVLDFPLEVLVHLYSMHFWCIEVHNFYFVLPICPLILCIFSSLSGLLLLYFSWACFREFSSKQESWMNKPVTTCMPSSN